jgi:type I restriction enzyme S subunit
VLEDCCKFFSGGTPAKSNANFWNGNIPWFSPKDIKMFDLLDSQDHITQDAIQSSATQTLPAGSILVVTRSGVLAHSLPVGLLSCHAAFNQDIKGIVPDSRFTPEYVALFLKASEKVAISQGVKIGATVHSIKSGYLESLRIPVIPLERQRSIACQLKVQLGETEKARQAADAQLHETSRLADAIVQNSLNHGTTQTWLLGDVLDEVKKGIGKDWADYPVLGATRASLAPAREAPGKHAAKYKPVSPGTVFYNPMRILIGSIAYVDDDDAPGITSPDYVALRGKQGVVDSRWFYHWLRSPLGEQCILSLARGAVRERMLFNRLAAGKIELPDYKEQLRASRALAELKPLRRAVSQSLNEINLMPAKILAQAFAMPSGGKSS